MAAITASAALASSDALVAPPFARSACRRSGMAKAKLRANLGAGFAADQPR
jgi:hypothetical protein